LIDSSFSPVVVPCNTDVEIKLAMGAATFSISSKDLTFRTIDDSGVNCTSGIAAWSLPTTWLVRLD
jgi:hypothetical protein